MIYITGATGHIGNNLVKKLAENQLDFRILARKTSIAVKEFENRVIIGDIFNKKFLEKNINEGDTLVHLAAYINLKNDKSLLTDEVNFNGVKTIADFCVEHNIHLIYTSSTDVITNGNYLINEPDTIDIDKLEGYYQRSKAKATNYLLNLMKNDNLKAMIVYPSAVLGINDFKPSAIGREIKRTFRRRICFYFHGGYNFVDVNDVAEVLMQGIAKEISGSYIVSNEFISLYNMYRLIFKTLKRKVLMIKIPIYLVRFAAFILPKYRIMIKALLTDHNFSNKKMIEELMINPVPINQTIQNTVTWFKGENNV
ncbi:MAG: NAD-dependent epimerase/dehydratase family protein [Candidatus Izemoplasmatales bacterium]|nr:NAD-dependent epimerase/dehydratase family protein [Candidatus Izemoplasmatales bacterium]